MDTIQIVGIISGIAIIVVPITGFFIKQFFNDLRDDIKDIKCEIKKLPCIIHESRISCIEGQMKGAKNAG